MFSNCGGEFEVIVDAELYFQGFINGALDEICIFEFYTLGSYIDIELEEISQF